MALEKKQVLRKMEYVFTEGEVHPVVHCLYHIVIEEDGVEISRTNHRENKPLSDMKSMLSSAKEFVHVEPAEPRII